MSPLRFGGATGTFATENYGDLRLRVLVLSALDRRADRLEKGPLNESIL